MNKTKKGMKFDGAADDDNAPKLRWDLLPIEEVEDVVDILTYGAQKYDDNNWQLVKNGTDRYYAALLRHLVAWRQGEYFDDESGKSHLAHACCNLIFLMWKTKNGDK